MKLRIKQSVRKMALRTAKKRADDVVARWLAPVGHPDMVSALLKRGSYGVLERLRIIADQLCKTPEPALQHPHD